MSYIVVLGNSYDIKPELKEKYGFSFNWDHKVWYRDCLEDKYTYWKTMVECLSKEVEACWVRHLSDIADLKQSIREEKIAQAKSIPQSEIKPHELDGAIFETSKWYGNIFKENNKTDYAFRNFKILKVKSESQKAYLVDAEFFSGIASTCGVCGRALDNTISKATGIGPICASKLGLPRPTMESAKEIVAQLEKLSAAQGVFKDVWIPKSQIKNITKGE